MAGINSTIKGFNVYLEAKEGKGEKKSIHKIFYSYISSWVRNIFFLLKKKKNTYLLIYETKSDLKNNVANFQIQTQIELKWVRFNGIFNST